MYIGTVKWFGARNGRDDAYGFLLELDGTSVYFNEHGIDPYSSFQERRRNGEYVVYERRQSKDSGKLSAYKVRLLDELNEKALQRLYQECCAERRDAELELLSNYAVRLFYAEPPAFFIPYLHMPHLQELFKKRCSELEREKLKEALEGHLTEKPVMDVLAPKYPEIFFDKDPEPYFPYLDHYPACENHAKTLFFERYRNGYFSVPIARIYGEWMKNTASSYNISDIFTALDLEREPLEDIIFLTLQAKALNHCIFPMIRRKPELLWIPEICACAEKIDFVYLPLEELSLTDEQAVFLARHTQDEAWQYISEQLPGKQLFRIEGGLRFITDEQVVSLISEVDWTDTSEENLSRYQPLLSKLEASGCPNAVMAAAVSLREKGAAFSLSWWKLLPDSAKVRHLIYLSNFKEERKDWFMPVKDVFKWETENGNLLLCAMLRFLVNIYTDRDDLRQKNFMDAHNMLMEYITNCFSAEVDVTPGLSALLEKCSGSTSKYFCEARIWAQKQAIFCPTSRRVCQDKDNLTETKFRSSEKQKADYKDQAFMDFLLNIGPIPDLQAIGIKDRTEYPFRISAYVNGLVRMRSHMKCSHCGEPFHPKFQYAKRKTAKLSINSFYCSRMESSPEQHDNNVYLNFCYHCHKIIDSRECQVREPGGGQYLCMHCGGAQYTKPGTVCPKCGCDNKSMLSTRGKSRILCDECGYDSAYFKSRFEN